ncbi:ARM repeat-containing protein [Xylaria digitata]|nr:ARM repeat-containing protein [Xylaria digitata]
MTSIKPGHVVAAPTSWVKALSLYPLPRRHADSHSTTPLPESSPQPSSHMENVRLCQVYPPPESAIATDIDILAIHGLDTDSPRTWTWKQKGQEPVNWLADSAMLPKRVPKARIFTCDWPGDLFERSDLVQKTIDEFARLLLASIRNRPPATNDSRPNSRPIVFIASCLGGVILMKALVMAKDEYLSVGQATRGIIFLATPFRGTSFQNVAEWAEPGLRTWAFVQNKNVSGLLKHVNPNFDLGELVRQFTGLCRTNELSNNVFTFYETGLTSLPRKIFPWLPAQGTPLVDQVSATLAFVPHPIPLDRPHIQMNKFDSPHNKDYDLVTGQVETLLRRIYEGSPIEIANTYIRTVCYSQEHLKIERLSGEQLPMDRCYINLVIVEHEANGSEKHKSSFSLRFRLDAELSQEKSEITLPTLFQTLHRGEGHVEPRRIMIHGRAGVGKTTLCKKIVYEFIHGNLWSDLFDWVLWVPLRNLKLEDRRGSAEYNFQDLFRHEYFAQHPKRDKLAEALWSALDKTKGTKFLFILDGLDEVSQDLERNMFRFLEELLNQPNIIITARPNARLPPNINPTHLELDTIGFHSGQIEAYMRNVFTDKRTGKLDSVKMKEIRSFLRDHLLIQDLVRIPIQLDVLCYIWDDDCGIKSNQSDTQETMTAIYQRIEQALWRKDAQNLEKVTQYQIQDTHDEEVVRAVDHEQRDLEFFAFYGMYNDVIDFEPEHRGAISKHSSRSGKRIIPLDRLLGQVSFLRSSDPSPKANIRRNYHFLHLTFQEYFGARYFVRQWKARQNLKCIRFRDENNIETLPTEFLLRNKYNPRYDVFWRFVVGLLASETDARIFYHAIEQEPRDLLGFTHQRLVIRCLSETSLRGSHCRDLEDQIVQWILFEYNESGGNRSYLANYKALPNTVIEKALQQNPGTKGQLLRLFSPLRAMSEQRARFIALYTKDEDEEIRRIALEALRLRRDRDRYHRTITKTHEREERYLRETVFGALDTGRRLPKEQLQAIVPRFESIYAKIKNKVGAIQALKDLMAIEESFQNIEPYMQHDNKLVRELAKQALRRPLPSEHLQATIACFEDRDTCVRYYARDTLRGQLVMEEHFQDFTNYLQHEKPIVRMVALGALTCRPISKKHLQAIIQRLKDEHSQVRDKALLTLRDRLATKEIFQNLAPYIQHKKWEVRWAALSALICQPLPEEYLQAVIVCLEDEHCGVRKAALAALKNRPVSREYLQAIVKRLEDDDDDVLYQVGRTLASLPVEEYFTSIVPYLQNQNPGVRKALLIALGAHTTLPQEVVQVVVSIVRDGAHDKDWDIVKRALSVLRTLPKLPEEILGDLGDAVTSRNSIDRYDNGYWRREAIEIIGAQPTIPTSVLQSITSCLGDAEDDASQATARIICRQGDLSFIPIEKIKPFYRALLRNAQYQDVTWQDVDNMSHITVGHDNYVSIWPDGFKDAIRDAQKEIGVPSQSSCIEPVKEQEGSSINTP